LPVPPINNKNKQYNKNLPGRGGVFNTINLNLYCYSGNNPVRFIDPNGKQMYTSEDVWNYFLNETNEGKFWKLHIDAFDGNQVSQEILLNLYTDVLIDQGIQITEFGGEVSGKATLLFLAVGQPEAAAVSSKISDICSYSKLALKTVRALRSGKQSDWDDVLNDAATLGVSKLVGALIDGQQIKIKIGKNGRFYMLGRRGALSKSSAEYIKIQQELQKEIEEQATEEFLNRLLNEKETN
jgi:hypothetical protein